MGILGVLFGSSKSRTLTNDNKNKKDEKPSGFDLVGGLTGTGRYAKTDEEKEEEKEARTLKVRLGSIGVKKYKDGRLPKYNDKSSKRRFEVGSDFDLRTLPNLIYGTARRSGIFRSHIGGRFSQQDRESLKSIMQDNSYRVRKVNQQLNNRNEKRCSIRLIMLFE